MQNSWLGRGGLGGEAGRADGNGGVEGSDREVSVPVAVASIDGWAVAPIGGWAVAGEQVRWRLTEMERCGTTRSTQSRLQKMLLEVMLLGFAVVVRGTLLGVAGA